MKLIQIHVRLLQELDRWDCLNREILKWKYHVVACLYTPTVDEFYSTSAFLFFRKSTL